VPIAPPLPVGAAPQSLESLQAALGDEFEIKQKIGRGSMATVYLAREKKLGRPCCCWSWRRSEGKPWLPVSANCCMAKPT